MNHEIWTAYEAAAATGGVLCAKGVDPEAEEDSWPEEGWSASGLSIDSRTLKPGEIFVALQDARDGHDYVRAAFERGASAALVSRAPKDMPKGKPLLMVNDTLSGLEAMAIAARNRCFGKLIAITGSVGKTSTKEMLRAALKPAARVHAALKSFNNHFGVPLTLAALPTDADFGIFEIGMNHANEITPLTKLVQPHVAVITTVAAAHLENFSSVDDIARAKAEIFSGLRRGGIAILPLDNPHYRILQKEAEKCGARIITFGESKEADFRLKDFAAKADKGCVTADLAGEEVTFDLQVSGRHQALNALAVLAAVAAVKGDRQTALEGLQAFSAVEGRGQRSTLSLNGRKFTLIDESYNANPVSMVAALSTLGTLPASRRIAILGDMLELGSQARTFHEQLADALLEARVDLVFCAGPLMKTLYDVLPERMRGGWAEAAIDLEQEIIHEITDGDLLIAKGSNGSKIGLLVTALQSLSNKQTLKYAREDGA